VKLETPLYRVERKVFQYLEPFARASRVWQTDGWTDRMAFGNNTVEHRWTRAKSIVYLLRAFYGVEMFY